ncbi:MAG TPA: type II toxin-antitoxin system VapC family toxin [Terriglobales bacterium]
MSRVVLDASVLLAFINDEPGSERLTPQILEGAAVSTVNLAEAQSKLVREGTDPDEAWEDVLSPIREAVEFTAEQAKIAGSLIAQTRSLGLSLGDRACLALGIALNAPIFTTDRSWKDLRVGVRIHVVR